MEGPPEDRGVNYRTLQQLFNTAEARREETSFTISVSLLEVCCHIISIFVKTNCSDQVAKALLEKNAH